MSDLIFAFGCAGDFYFYSRKKTISASYWETGKADLLSFTTIDQPVCVALGPNLDYFFGYRCIKGELKLIRKREKSPEFKLGSLHRQWSERQEAYDKLQRWLQDFAIAKADMAQTRLALGAGGSYFACSPTGGVIWNELPSSLQKVFDRQQSDMTPSSVVFGIKGTWFVLWPNGSSSCNLDDEYPNLESLMKKYGKFGIKEVALSPSTANHYAITFRNQRTYIQGPVSEANLRQLNEIAKYEAKKGRGPLCVTVCGMYAASAPVTLPHPVLLTQKLPFYGSERDRAEKRPHSDMSGQSAGGREGSLISRKAVSCTAM
ncbi:hypothetical protein MMC21_008430 [Puttea exsequens]|nr:hypothetical protein [Puttea exsequens]